MMYKFAGVITALALTLSTVGMASADYHSYRTPSSNIRISTEHTQIINGSASIVNTGLNSQSGSLGAKQTLYTGAATRVSSSAIADVNTTILPACNTCSRGDISVRHERTQLVNVGVTGVNTGANRQTGSLWSNQTTGTGAVDTVSAVSSAMVNYTGFSVSAN